MVPFRAGAALAVRDGFFKAAGLVTTVVLALETLVPLVLASASGSTGFTIALPPPFRQVVREAARDAGALLSVLEQLVAGFSGALKGERGNVRELCDLGERTANGTGLAREAVRVAFVFALAAAVFVRFFGLGIPWTGFVGRRGCDGSFSLSS